MKLFDLFEARRNKDVNVKVSKMDALRKYAGQEDVFVTFTSDVGAKSHMGKTDPYTDFGTYRRKGELHNASGHKLGINPKSEYETPLGIYAYPIDYVLELDGKVPFAHKEPFLNVFRSAGNILNLSEVTSKDVAEMTAKLRQHEVFKSLDVERAKRWSKVSSAGGQFWNITRIAAQLLAVKGSEDDLQYINYSGKFGQHDESDEQDDDDDYGYDPQDDDDDQEDDVHESLNEAASRRSTSVQWGKLMRDLGYTGAVDFGSGIVHENEPTQAVFFSKEGVRLIEVIDNIDPQAKWTQEQIWLKSHSTLLAALHKGQVSDEQMMDLLKNNMAYFAYGSKGYFIPFEILPQGVKDWYQENVVTFADIYQGRELFNYVATATPDQVMEFVNKHPDRLWEIPQRLMTKEIFKRVIAEPQKYEQTITSCQVPPDIAAAVIRKEPRWMGTILHRASDEYLASDLLMNTMIETNLPGFMASLALSLVKLGKISDNVAFNALKTASENRDLTVAFMIQCGHKRPDGFVKYVETLSANEAFGVFKQCFSYANLQNMVLKARPDVKKMVVDEQREARKEGHSVWDAE